MATIENCVPTLPHLFWRIWLEVNSSPSEDHWVAVFSNKDV